MNTSWSAGRLAATAVAAALLLGACTSSGDSGKSSPAPSSTVGSGSSTVSSTGSSTPVGAGTVPASGPGAGSTGPASDTYTPPTKAPYSTPGRDPEKVTDQTGVLKSLPGSKKTSCGNVGSNTDLRSGGVAMGNFQEAKRSYSEQVGKTEKPELNLYVIPQHAKKLTSATIRVEPPKGKATTIRTKQVEEAEPYSYFAVVLPIRDAGTYRLTVRSGVDQGCFSVSFGK